MRPLLLVLVLLVGVVYAAVQYKDHSARVRLESASQGVVSPPAAPALSLEERAAKAQGTTLPPQVPRSSPRPVANEPVERAASAVPAVRFRCDGRSRCPEMHSCEEARWFLQNCPGTKMDGDGDGEPCEEQWCSRR